MPFLRTFAFILAGAMTLAGAFGCSGDPTKNAENSNQSLPNPANVQPANSQPANVAKGATIEIDPNGPADTVRVFYKDLREKKFREAIFLTNIRPAVEGLTDTELKDFSVDFESIAGDVPEQIQINGEIVSGDHATVTANLPDRETDKDKIETIKLVRENGVWIIQTADAKAEKAIKQDGRRYLYNLRMDTHQNEARKMLDRITKAEIAYSLQNGGNYAGIDELVAGGLLPEDAQSSESTGYNYSITVAPDKKKYSASATPAAYGKTGRLSFSTVLDAQSIAHMNGRDNGGKPLSK